MCGIAGIVGQIGERNREALRRMSEALVHRGPDASGSFESTPDPRGRGVLLAHRRLAILDLSPAGAQPMVDPETGDVLVFNGEIYNYLELRERLTALGQRFESSGDTEVLLRALEVEGADALPRLRGMYAFAQFRPGQGRLLLARDPLGMKPLYLARSSDPRSGFSLVFASELRALLASGLFPTPRLDPEAVASLVWNGFVVGPGTAVRGVELVPSGRAVEVDLSGAEVWADDHWRMRTPSPQGRTDEAQVAQALAKSVRLHLASDVPLAVFLSAGIDSSAIANLAKRSTRAPVHTFTLAFEEEELNEGPAARRIAEAIGTDHREIVLTEERFTSELKGAIDAIDQPTFDGVNAYILSRAIRSAGFTVALAGTGGDELFGGYPSFRELPILIRLLEASRFLPGPARRAAAALGAAALSERTRNGVPAQARWAKLPAMVSRGPDLLGLYQLAYALFVPAFQKELLAPDVADALIDGLPRGMLARLMEECRGRSPISAVSVLEERLFLGERLLRDNDVASMAVSLEQRVPFVDQVVWETVDRLSDDLRFRPAGRKALLRRVGLIGLDPALFDRPKSWFVLPFARWIRRGLRDEVDRTLRDPELVSRAGLRPRAVERLWKAFLDGGAGIYWSRVWALYVLVRWCARNRLSI